MNLSVQELRKRHPKFVYNSFKYELAGQKLNFAFNFEIEPNLSFNPTLTIHGVDEVRLKRLDKRTLDNFAFHLGLIEIPSYWKLSCSPIIEIKAGSLDDYQISWWKDLLFKGLGEFFYTNKIDFTVENFITLNSSANEIGKSVFILPLNPQKYLVPVGGGKDSAVTTELLKSNGFAITSFSLNSIQSTLDIIRAAGINQLISVSRKIDPNLVLLNKSGYLNGHTPFSAYATFLISICAVIFDFKYVINSNERSANEGNAQFKENEINHQYSKSHEFEKKFREYSKKYLAPDLEYFSFLRPLFELQIGKIFSGMPKYFSVFRSCNVGQKTNVWCHNCAKCLFVYLILYPFVDKQVLTSTIFSADLFEKKELLTLLKKFIDQGEIKPFDCVGTRDETRLAAYLCLEKAKKENGRLPVLLQMVEEEVLKIPNLERAKNEVLKGWDDNNFLTSELKAILQRSINL